MNLTLIPLVIGLFYVLLIVFNTSNIIGLRYFNSKNSEVFGSLSMFPKILGFFVRNFQFVQKMLHYVAVLIIIS